MNSKEFAEKLRELRKADKEAFARGTVTVAYSLPGRDEVLKLEYEVWWSVTDDDLCFHLPEDEQQKSDRYHHPDWPECPGCREIMSSRIMRNGLCFDCASGELKNYPKYPLNEREETPE